MVDRHAAANKRIKYFLGDIVVISRVFNDQAVFVLADGPPFGDALASVRRNSSGQFTEFAEQVEIRAGCRKAFEKNPAALVSRDARQAGSDRANQFRSSGFINGVQLLEGCHVMEMHIRNRAVKLNPGAIFHEE